MKRDWDLCIRCRCERSAHDECLMLLNKELYSHNKYQRLKNCVFANGFQEDVVMAISDEDITDEKLETVRKKITSANSEHTQPMVIDRSIITIFQDSNNVFTTACYAGVSVRAVLKALDRLPEKHKYGIQMEGLPRQRPTAEQFKTAFFEQLSKKKDLFIASDSLDVSYTVGIRLIKKHESETGEKLVDWNEVAPFGLGKHFNILTGEPEKVFNESPGVREAILEKLNSLTTRQISSMFHVRQSRVMQIKVMEESKIRTSENKWTESICIDYIKSYKYNNRLICPNCQDTDYILYMESRKAWKGRYCRKSFSLFKGTIMENSKIHIATW